MDLQNMNNKFSWWFGPYLPKEHTLIKGNSSFRRIVSTLVLQPVKRHLAHLYLPVLVKSGTKIIGITGSAGKTTTKEMIASVLSQRFNTKWTPKNIDPVFSIPDTCLKTLPGTKALILEMGIEYPGEMDYYLWLTKPQIGVITNVYWTHTEFLGDVNGVFEEKSKLIKSLPPSGWAVINYDDKRLRELVKKTKAKVILIGKDKKCDFRLRKVLYTNDFKTVFVIDHKGKSFKIKTSLLGGHFGISVLASFAIGKIFGLSLKDIKEGIEITPPQPHRLNPILLENKTLIIDDTYNANPLATKESLKVLSEIGKGGRKVFVFGEMKELGEYEEKGHKEVGKEVASLGIDFVLAIGKATKHTLSEAEKNGISREHLLYFENKEKLLKKLRSLIRPKDIILVKGSRSMGMEEIVDSLISQNWIKDIGEN